jgi:hypothetical protein
VERLKAAQLAEFVSQHEEISTAGGDSVQEQVMAV